MVTLLSLPPEILESVLVWVAAIGSPHTIGILAQTCHALRALIYEMPDNHLWRAIFLTTFDDPRRLIYYSSEGLNWGAEYRERVWAVSFLKRHVRPLHVQKVYNLRSRSTASAVVDLTATYDVASSIRMLTSLRSVINTTAPDEKGVGVFASDKDGNWLTKESLLHNRSLSYAFHCTSDFPVRVQGFSGCLNVPWLKSVLQHGLPAALTAKISGRHRDLEWDRSPEALALGQVLVCTGFLPVSQIVEERTSRLASASETSAKVALTLPGVSDLDMSVAAQNERAQHRARELVYKMAYLSRRRNWGPYLPVAPSSEDEPSSPVQDPVHHGITFVFTGVDDSDEELGSESDEDYVPGMDDASSSSDLEGGEGRNEQADTVQVQSRKRKRVLPSPEQLVPDWTWLAAARIVMEMNLREYETERLDEFISWDIWRESWVGGRREPWFRSEKDAAKPKASKLDEPVFRRQSEEQDDERGDELTHRDWAGVQGIWRRCVSWLGYADLIHHNHFRGFDDPVLHECMIIVPLRLRVVGYDPPAIAAYPDRPTIRLEGEMGGQDWEGNEDGVGDDSRRVHGTVSMLSCGNVRWSLTSSEADDGDTDLWASEGIQIGAVGSDAGVVGVWTGARHEAGDPLGPFWQWRVA